MTPKAEVDISESLVRALLQEQAPDLANLTVTRVASGWDNDVFRLGEDRAVRLPRRDVAVPLIANEQRWLPGLGRDLPIAIPVPELVGRPGCGYPWPWSVVPWFPGAPIGPASVVATWPSDRQHQLASDLGAFLGRLHTPAPADAPINPHRGGLLPEREDLMQYRFSKLAAGAPAELHQTGLTRSHLSALPALWRRQSESPPHPGPPTWVHGDIHPLNVIAHEQEIQAVIDFGDLTSGDPACDLGAAWLLLPVEHHGQFRESAANEHRLIDDDTWQRAGGWAMNWSLAVATTSDDPIHLQIAGETLQVLVESAATG